jgi:hypothetical protein
MHAQITAVITETRIFQLQRIGLLPFGSAQYLGRAPLQIPYRPARMRTSLQARHGY